MPNPTDGLITSPTDTAERGLLIVARDQGDLYAALQQAFGDSQKITLVLDRRQEDRRRGGQTVAADRRRMERRSLPHIEDDLRVRKYVLTRPHQRRPHE